MSLEKSCDYYCVGNYFRHSLDTYALTLRSTLFKSRESRGLNLNVSRVVARETKGCFTLDRFSYVRFTQEKLKSKFLMKLLNEYDVYLLRY